jgi:predicted transglutaminase-like cysteine proteinase
MSKYTDEEVKLMEDLCRELLNINEDLNAKIIAMDSMCRNSDSRSRMWERRYFTTLSDLNECKEANDIINLN